ncbi:uncharacterized protein LOC130054554 [Ostrea edulis]|uniref:uncharacterized protein LOC130054554 n=1 Tax=Ostrea edulis TaxID=37623 RepID=UPI0024AFA688|nr:uncharacterized protein LOC130054554 [Ostrea edulis]
MESPIEGSRVPESTESNHSTSSPKVTGTKVKPNTRYVAHRLCSRPQPSDSVSLPIMDKIKDEESKMSSNERKSGKRKTIQLIGHHNRPQATTCSAGISAVAENKDKNSAIFPANRNGFSLSGVHANFTSTSRQDIMTSSHFANSTPRGGQHSASIRHISSQSPVSSSAMCSPRSTVSGNSTKGKEKSNFKYTNCGLVPSKTLVPAQNGCTLRDNVVSQKHKTPPTNGSPKIETQTPKVGQGHGSYRKENVPKTKTRDIGTLTVFGSETFRSSFQEYISTGRICNKKSRIPVRIDTHKLSNAAHRRYSDGTERNIKHPYQSTIVKRVNNKTNLSLDENQHSKEMKRKIRAPPTIPNTKREGDSNRINAVERRVCESKRKPEGNRLGYLKGNASTTNMEWKEVDDTQKDVGDRKNYKDDVVKVKSKEYDLHGMFQCMLQ